MSPDPVVRRVQCVELRCSHDVAEALREAALFMDRTPLHLIGIDVQTEHREEYGTVIRLTFALPRS